MDLAQILERSLLEACELPIGDLTRFAARDGPRPHRNKRMHKWFARRTGCCLRTAFIRAAREPPAGF